MHNLGDIQAFKRKNEGEIWTTSRGLGEDRFLAGKMHSDGSRCIVRSPCGERTEIAPVHSEKGDHRPEKKKYRAANRMVSDGTSGEKWVDVVAGARVQEIRTID